LRRRCTHKTTSSFQVVRYGARPWQGMLACFGVAHARICCAHARESIVALPRLQPTLSSCWPWTTPTCSVKAPAPAPDFRIGEEEEEAEEAEEAHRCVAIPCTYTMQSLRTSTRVASQFRAARMPRLARTYASATTYEHILVSTPKPGVGFSTFTQRSSSTPHPLKRAPYQPMSTHVVHH
jgi:hypothetical protein